MCTNCCTPPVYAYLQLSISHQDCWTLLLTINVACEDKQASVLKWGSSRQWPGHRNIHIIKSLSELLTILVVIIQLRAVEVWEKSPWIDLSCFWLCSPSLFKRPGLHCYIHQPCGQSWKRMDLLIPDTVWRCLPPEILSWIYRRQLTFQSLDSDAFQTKNVTDLKSMSRFSILPVSKTEWKVVDPYGWKFYLQSSTSESLETECHILAFVFPLCLRTCFETLLWPVGWLSLVFTVRYYWNFKNFKTMLTWSNVSIFRNNFFWPDFSFYPPVIFDLDKKQYFFTFSSSFLNWQSSSCASDMKGPTLFPDTGFPW